MIPQLETVAETIRWAGLNFAHNLKFVPQDKLHWKPGPDASSAMELAAHVILVTKGVEGAFAGGEYHGAHGAIEDLAGKLDLETAQARIVEVTESYAQMLGRLRPEDLEGDFILPGGFPFSRRRLVSLPAMDAMHHHGQLAYIQLLLGDTQSHFYDFGS